MVHQIYSVYDVKAAAYLRPFFSPTRGIAVRVFFNEAQDPTTTIGANPEDYSLHYLGTFDDETGFIETDNKPTLVHTGLEAIAANNKE